MKKFKRFRLASGLAKEARQGEVYKDPLRYLKRKAPKKMPQIRQELIEEVYRRASGGEPLRVTGYPGCGKSTVLGAVLHKSHSEEPAGLGITVHQHIGGYHLDFSQIKAVWALIDRGYEPRFLIIDDGTELVPALQKALAGEPRFLSVDEYALVLDILAKLPDSTPLVLSFPSIHTTHNNYNRESTADFFGQGSKIIVPSFLRSDDFAALFNFAFSSGLGRRAADEVREKGLCGMVADYLGLYEGNISTILLRWVLWPSSLFDLSGAESRKEIAAAVNESRIMQDFVVASKGGLTMPRSFISAALDAFNGNARNCGDATELRMHGIVLDSARHLGQDTLTYRAFVRARDIAYSGI
jgi:hypothetical protein